MNAVAAALPDRPEAVDKAAFRNLAVIESAAEYLLENEADKIDGVANQVRFRGAIQNLRLYGEQFHNAAHEGAEALLGNLGIRIGRELKKIAGLMRGTPK